MICQSYIYNSFFLNTTQQDSLLPNIVIVRKYYPKTYKTLQKHGRGWRLKALNIEEEQVDYGVNDRKTKKKQARQKKMNEENRAHDMESLMQDLQEDNEMRKKINMYRNDVPTTSGKVNGLAPARRTVSKSGGSRSGGSSSSSGGGGGGGDDDSDESDLEDDFPEIQLSELLDDLSMGGSQFKDGEQYDRVPGEHLTVAVKGATESDGLLFMAKNTNRGAKGVMDNMMDGVKFTGVHGKSDQTAQGGDIDPVDDDDL